MRVMLGEDLVSVYRLSKHGIDEASYPTLSMVLGITCIFPSRDALDAQKNKMSILTSKRYPGQMP
jgi:hypothetical protein